MKFTQSWGLTVPVKSTLGNVLAGRPGYEVTSGTSDAKTVKDIFAMDTEERAREGVFLAFQYPVEIPWGVES